MKIAFPIKENKGLTSSVDEHFGNAKMFLILDMETKKSTIKENPKLSGEKSACKTGVIGEEDKVDAVITNCMGDGSLRNLNSINIKVYEAQADTIAENLELLEKDELKLFHIFDLCRDKKNKKEGGCGHHH